MHDSEPSLDRALPNRRKPSSPPDRPPARHPARRVTPPPLLLVVAISLTIACDDANAPPLPGAPRIEAPAPAPLQPVASHDAPFAPRRASTSTPVEPLGPNARLEDERNTIEVFRTTANAVVYVTSSRLPRGFLGRGSERGTGSGFVWDDEGHIVTNFHVVQGGDAFVVSSGDGQAHEARLVGFDPNKDLAVLKIDPGGDWALEPIARGDSARLDVGQKVLAIGNPFGLDHTLTTGIVSAIGREMTSIGGTTIEGVIQTDASINPGNSGGPLLDSAGLLIGVNTMIVGPAHQSAGIGFAIPVNTVERVVPQRIEHGEVERVGLGVRVLPDGVAQRWGVRGVVVSDVAPHSAAARAGLRSLRSDRRGNVHAFDAITAIDGEPIHCYDDLYGALDGRSLGDEVEVRFQRGAREHVARAALQRIN